MMKARRASPDDTMALFFDDTMFVRPAAMVKPEFCEPPQSKPVYYRWQMSTDQQTWTDLPETFRTKSVVEDLVPATVYSFRLRTVTNNGPSEWSPPVTIVAH